MPTRGGPSFGPLKSRRSHRTIALDAGTVGILRAHRATQLLERDFAADGYVDRDLVVCDPLGAPIHPQRLTDWFGVHRKAAGIPVDPARPAAHRGDARSNSRRAATRLRPLGSRRHSREAALWTAVDWNGQRPGVGAARGTKRTPFA